MEKIKILYEDDISYYVESFSEPVDSRGFRKRYSVKKHCHILESLIENSFCYKTLCVNTRPYMFLTEEEKEYLHQNESRVFILTAAGDWCNYANYSYSSNSVFRVI